MSISSYLVLRSRITPGPAGTSPRDLWSKWYVPLLAAALGLAGLMVAAVVTLEILTASPERPLTPLRQQEQLGDLVSDVEWIGAQR